jgi:hypothetical protein
MSANVNLSDPRNSRIIFKVHTPDHADTGDFTIEIVPDEKAPGVTITTRDKDIRGYEIQSLHREARKTMAVRTYLFLQSINFVLLWVGVLPAIIAITANVYFTWRITKLLS